MNEKFFDLKKEKQDRMINGAMKVFALNGYKRASTDEMVKEAGISKGLWFHYFDSKLGLYSFITEYAIRYMNMELQAMTNREPQDYFATRLQVEKTKLMVRKSYPYIPLFLASLEKERDEDALLAVMDAVENYRNVMKKIYADVDESKFRESVKRTQLDMTVGYTLDGLLFEAYEEPVFDEDGYRKVITEYLAMMKDCFEKESEEERVNIL
ncbi:MAG: TetR/AcrR family transcriptional regulator [Lachnospiraceae bacterium]|nr:TetR/AcrR family transcriptional regulator [Lachnospiraceae bacterium]